MLFKIGDKFITPSGGVLYTIDSICNDDVIIKWNNTGKIEYTHIGEYDVNFVNQCFSDGSWRSIKQIRKAKLQKINENR